MILPADAPHGDLHFDPAIAHPRRGTEPRARPGAGKLLDAYFDFLNAARFPWIS